MVKLLTGTLLVLIVAAFGIIMIGHQVKVARRPRYTICMANCTHQDFSNVAVYYREKMAAAAGLLVKGGLATYGILSLPIPEEATVTWRDEKGENHEPSVKLVGVVPPMPKDQTIYFIIEEDASVTVKCLHNKDFEGDLALLQPLIAIRNEQKK